MNAWHSASNAADHAFPQFDPKAMDLIQIRRWNSG